MLKGVLFILCFNVLFCVADFLSVDLSFAPIAFVCFSSWYVRNFTAQQDGRDLKFTRFIVLKSRISNAGLNTLGMPLPMTRSPVINPCSFVMTSIWIWSINFVFLL